MLSIKVLAAVGLSIGTATICTAQQAARQQAVLPRAEVSLSYSYIRANATPGVCGCFNMNGGSAELAVHAYRGFSGVFDLTGDHAGTTSVPGQSLTLLTFTGGPRFSHSFHAQSKRSITPFVQGLVGAVHGFDAPFPNSSGSTSSSATALAVLVGGGLDISLSPRIAVRPIQADYGLTHLPNNANNSQNLLRLSAGLVVRLP